MTALHETELPSGAHLLRLLPDTDPDTGITVFTARPARRDYVQGQDLLGGLGKDGEVTGGGRRHTEDTLISQAWLLAHEIHTIVVRAAEHVEPGYLMTLHLLSNAVGATLVLCRDYDSGQHVLDYVRNHGGSRVSAEDIIATVQQAASTAAARPEPGVTVRAPKHLPQYDFPLFRAACRRMLSPDEFERVDRIYVDGFRAAHKTKPCTAEEARLLLDRLFVTCAGVSEAIIVTRAVQAAMFLDAQHLKVDFDALAEHVSGARHRRLTGTEVRSLRAYREPWRSSAAILADANLSLDDIARLPIAAAHATGEIDSVDVHPEGHVLIRALRTLRHLEGASPSDLLINRSLRHIGTALKDAGQDLNLAVAPPSIGPGARKADRWQHVHGVLVEPLTGTTNRKERNGKGKGDRS